MTEDIHIFPLDDKRGHVLEGADCACEPKIELYAGARLIIHNAYDFREIAEELNNGGGA